MAISSNSIAELMKRKTKKRIAREADLAKREAAGDFRHLQDKQGRFKDGRAPLAQPTLPSIDLADEELYGDGKSDAASSNYHGNSKGGPAGGPYGYPPMPSIPDLAYAGFPDSNYSQPRYQLNDTNNDSAYDLSQQNYPYPSNMRLPSESFVSLVNDDKASIRSKDPLLYAELGMRGQAAQSEVSLNRAPSYKTQEDEHAQMTYNFGQAYQSNSESQHGYSPQQQYNETRGNSLYEEDRGHTYAEPPYAIDRYDLEQRDSYGFGRQEQQQQPYGSHQYPQHSSPHSTRSQSPSYASEAQGHSQPQSRGFAPQPPSQSNLNPTARGVSIAGRSDITTYYGMEDRDRASMADSHAGAFDLDEYARASMFNPTQQLNSHAHWQQQHNGQQEGRLEHLDEEDEDVQDESLQQEHGYFQQDWRR